MNSQLNKPLLLNVAINATKKAAFFLRGREHLNVLSSKENKKDIKLLEDIGAQEIIIETLDKEGDFPIIAEEGHLRDGAKTQLLDNICWVVDPLDGTFNYWKGIPLSCVSIGLWERGKPVLGVVYNFNADELFTGIVGMGAWLNDEPIKVSSTACKEDAVLATGLPVSMSFSHGMIASLIEYCQSFKKIRMFGSASISLSYVACGRVDMYYEKDIKIWDVAAGIALVESAGGKCEFCFSREKENCLEVCAGNGFLTPSFMKGDSLL